MLRVIVLSLCAIVLMAQQQPTDFDYNSHGDDWDCPKNGKKQSPIALSTSEGIQKSLDSFLFGDFINTTGAIYFLNTTIYINTPESFGSVYVKLIDANSVPFKANQIRLRMHSEHKTEQGYYDLQIQIFHTELYTTSRNLKLAIGLFFNVSQSADPFVQEIINAYQKNKTQSTLQVNLGQILTTNYIQDFWFYLGSPTIPYCSDGKMHWIVSRRIYSITQQQKDKLIQILSNGDPKWPGNWRNIQAQNQNQIGFRHISQLFSQ